MTLDTSVSDLQTTFQHLNQLVRQALAMPG
jgi:hypothetical protein